MIKYTYQNILLIKKIKDWLELKFYYLCISKINFFYKKKNKFNYKFRILKSLLENKKILLLGNAKVNLKKIDYKKYDTIIRINILPLSKNINSIRSKTDILMLNGSGGSFWVLKKNIVKVWLDYNTSMYSNYAKGECYHYPKIWYLKLQKKLKAHPTAGALSLDFLVRILNNPNISLYGFTFSPSNWYDKNFDVERAKKIHNYHKEKIFFYNISKKYKNINIYKI